MTPKQIFEALQCGPWETVGMDTQYRFIETPDTLYLLFQCSEGKEDWRNNFAFPAVPYKDMPTPWRAHGGFVRVWKVAEDTIKARVDSILARRKLVIAGYSHGAAVTVLGHEFFDFNAYSVTSYGFGCPRVLWLPPAQVEWRFRNFTVYNNHGDIVGHLPPSLFGYKHPPVVHWIGRKRIISHLPHYPAEYLKSLGEL